MRLRRAFAALLLATGSCLFLAAAAPSAYTADGRPSARIADDEPPPSTPVEREAVETAIAAAVAADTEVLAFLIFDVQVQDLTISSDGMSARASLAFFDKDTGDIVPTEPGLALAIKTPEGWTAILQSDPRWNDFLDATPEELLPSDSKSFFALPPPRAADADADFSLTALTGYKLPWASGTIKYLSRSLSHGGDSYYAWDFFGGGQFPILASRSGRVKRVSIDYPDDYHNFSNCNEANYLVLEDTTTSPTSYQVYLHLAYNSIPAPFRTVGASVARGAFIGNAGNTGCSSGNHLHFQVHNNSYSWWGTSVDIRFDEVTVNGGRPCTTAEQGSGWCSTGQDSYYSANNSGTDFTPPTAGLTLPVTGTSVSGSTVSLSGWGADSGTGFSHAYFLANWGGGWQQIGPVQTSSPFSYTWDMCAAGVPAGPVSFSVRAWDMDGNPSVDYPDVRGIVKASSCAVPAPACSVTSTQVAVFAGANFTGACAVKPVGNFSNGSAFLPVGGDAIRSVMVGSGVRLTLFSDENYLGRSETFSASDRNLADNIVLPATTSSFWIVPDSNNPYNPTWIWPQDGATFTYGDALLLHWRGGAGTEMFGFDIRGYGPPPAQVLPYLMIPGYTPNEWPGRTNYPWYIHACNTYVADPYLSHCSNDWPGISVNLVPLPALPTPAGVPYAEHFESAPANWTANGLWRLAAGAGYGGSQAYTYNNGINYNNGSPNAGFLTSPPVSIPSAGYFLQFRYLFETEANTVHWDQRHVQISVDGGKFTDLLWLTEDRRENWLVSPAVDLSAYAGHSIRVRFYFATLDNMENNHPGWVIDDLTIAPSSAPACADANEPNNIPAAATAISTGGSKTGMVCSTGTPALLAVTPGDVDMFQFTAAAGARLVARLTGVTALAPHIEILDSDGASVLGSADGTLAGATAPHAGTYYIRLRSQYHPAAGGTNHGYILSLITDTDLPTVSFTSPASNNGYIGGATQTITVAAADAGGLEKVDLYYLLPDWQSSAWTHLCTDTNGGDGWSCTLSTSGLAEGAGYALAAVATDWAGGQSAAALWNLTMDRTAPALTVTPLASPLGTSLIRMQWTASDATSGIDRFRIAVNIDGGGWTVWQNSLPAATTEATYYGQPGHSYSFQVIAIDKAGNLTQLVTSTSVQACGNDSFEPDNTRASAAVLLPSVAQTHNFCGAGDTDWVSFNVLAGIRYVVRGLPLGPTTAVSLTLMDLDGLTPLWSFAPASTTLFAGPSTCWTAPADGTYFLRLQHANAQVAGPDVAYTLEMTPGQCLYSPLKLR